MAKKMGLPFNNNPHSTGESIYEQNNPKNASGRTPEKNLSSTKSVLAISHPCGVREVPL
ncbi:MAG: hypothetical protein ACFE8J_08705 [Candidatus Heimdallarchaeota archaeon]